MIGIYKIECIKNNKIYVGSAIDTDKRWIKHKCELGKNKHHNRHMQNAYNLYGIESFIFKVIEECSLSELIEREQYYLDQIFKDGNTFNICSVVGTRLGCKHSEDSKIKMSNSQKGKILSDDTKKKLSDINKGKKLSKQSVDKIITSKKGFKHTKETIDKMSKSQKGKIRTQEQKDTISNTLKGRIASQETKLKQSIAQKNRIRFPRSEETKRKISETLKARRLT